jgi:hypothetical protein
MAAQPSRLPEVPETMRLAERLAGIFAETAIEAPPQEDLDLISRRIGAALATGEPLSYKDLRRAPWCIFATNTPLADHPYRLDMLLARIAEVTRRKIYRALANAYLYSFQPSRPGLPTVGVFLARHVEDLGAPWIEAHRALDLFLPDTGPGKVADLALAAARTPDHILADAHIGGATSYSGFCEHAYRLGYERLEQGGDLDPMQRLDIITQWAFVEAGKVRFDTMCGPAVNAAVLPFGEAMPDKITRDKCLALVLSLLGDPRTQPARWSGCARAEIVVRRWLTEQSLRQFFDIVGRVAKVEHWTYRRAFWDALYKNNYIDEAWVVFESSGASEARRLFGKDISFGRFGGGSIQAGHSVLLLKIGTLTIAEWSHDSPCSIWNEGDDEIGPRLYKPAYEAGNLKKRYEGSTSGDNLEKQGVFWHRGSDSYAWQDRIARFLRQRQDIIINRADYEVR